MAINDFGSTVNTYLQISIVKLTLNYAYGKWIINYKKQGIANTFKDHFATLVDNFRLNHWDNIICHQGKVLIGLIILSNCIKTTSASRTSK